MNARSANIALAIICLALTGALAYTVMLLRKPLDVSVGTDPFVVTNTVTQTQIAVRKIHPTNLLAALANRPLNWSSIESTNYHVYISNLRAIGCPDETIKDIVLTDIAKLYGRRRAALRAGEVHKFWLTDGSWDQPNHSDPQIQAQLRALDEEQSALVRQLLDVDDQAELAKYYSNGVDYQQRMFGFLPEEKQQQVISVHNKYDQLQQDIYARTKGFFLPEDEKELRRLQQEKEKELAGVLTAQEMEDYQVRNSPTAETLRAQLSGFEPNEAEFRRLFRLQKVYDDTVAQTLEAAGASTDPEASERAQAAAGEALNDELKKTLGEKRYQEYVRAQDDDYRQLRQLSERLQLPPETASRVYDMRQAAERQKERVEADPNLTPAQRLRALAAIGQETENALSSVMGSKPFATYKNTGPSWLEELRRSQEMIVQDEILSQPVELPPLPPGFP